MKKWMFVPLLLLLPVIGCTLEARRNLFYPGGNAAYERDQRLAAIEEKSRVHSATCHGKLVTRSDRECIEEDIEIYQGKANLLPLSGYSELAAFARMQAERVFGGQMTRVEWDYLIVQKASEIQNRQLGQALQVLQLQQQIPAQPNVLQRAGEVLQGRPDPLYSPRGLHCTSKYDPISRTTRTDCY